MNLHPFPNGSSGGRQVFRAGCGFSDGVCDEKDGNIPECAFSIVVIFNRFRNLDWVFNLLNSLIRSAISTVLTILVT